MNRKSSFIFIFIITLLATGLYWCLWGNIGLRLADEGLLWYNSVRTLHGDIPMRDLQSYDPGRYYWNAFFMQWFGEGILGVRLSILVFQSFAFACAVLILRRVIRSWGLLLFMIILVAMWMFPIHKAYDHSLSIMSVYVAILLIEHPTMKRYFFTGVFIGISAVIGRNHGFYNLLIFAALSVYIYFTINKDKTCSKITLLAGGIIIGYLPMLVMLAIIPGFFDGAFIYPARYLANLQTTNITLPIPWPWRINYYDLSSISRISSFLIGSLFVIIPLYYICVAVSLFRHQPRQSKEPEKAVVIASFFVGIIYIHYAFSRADLGHLALSIHPFLLGSMALAVNKNRRWWQIYGAVGLLAVSTAFTVGINSPYYAKYTSPGSFQVRQIQGDSLWIDPSTTGIIDVAIAVQERLAFGESLLIAPHWPGLYAVLGQESPVWETYFLVKQLADKQEQMITQLEKNNTSLIILGDVPLDQRDDLRFSNTHPILYKYITKYYIPIAEPRLPSNHQLWQRKKVVITGREGE